MLLGLIRPTAGIARALRARPARGRRAGARRRRRLRRGPALLPVPLGPQEPAPARRLRRRRRSRRASRRCSTSSSCATARRTASAATRTACASGSASPRRCCASRSCCCSTSRRPGSTRPGCATCASSCAGSRDEGITILLSSHLLAEVEELCNRVAIIRSGRIVYEGLLDELLRERAPAATACARPIPSARAPCCSRSGHRRTSQLRRRRAALPRPTRRPSQRCRVALGAGRHRDHRARPARRATSRSSSSA